MAITKMLNIKKDLGARINYIVNPAKTDGTLLTYAYNCTQDTAPAEFKITQAGAEMSKGNYFKNGGTGNEGYHLIQSFSPDDNVTPEQAIEIGKKLADEFLQGKFEYVVATHIDKGHIHNHIIINATSFYDYKKLRTAPYKTASTIRSISDKLCAEYNLSVVEENKKLAYSYCEYRNRKQNTSWKSEIRKKLNFVLEQAVSYDDFIDKANMLGVEINDSKTDGQRLKNISYKLRNGAKSVRGNKLADTSTYAFEGIDEKIQLNKKAQTYIKESIQSVATKSATYDEFEKALKENFKISFKKNKAGNYSINIDDSYGTVINDYVLGFAYTPVVIEKAIRNQQFNFDIENNNNIDIEFNKKVHTKADDDLIAINLSGEQIEKIVDGNSEQGLYSGILLNVADKGNIFIDCMHIDYNNIQDKYTVYIGDKYDYYFTEKELNPDISEKDQLSSQNIKGNKLIEYLEIQNKIKPQEIYLQADDIAYLTEKGLGIKLTEEEIAFIPIEFVETNKQQGSCKIKVYDNWKYNIQDNTNIRKTIKGIDISASIQKEKVQSDKTLSVDKRILNLQRKQAKLATKDIAQSLVKISKSETKDFEKDIKTLIGKSIETKALNASLENEIREIKKVNALLAGIKKYDVVYNKYTELINSNKSERTKKKFYKENEDSIKAFEFAVKQLEKVKVNIDVDPNKVSELVKHKENEFTSNENLIRSFEKEISEIEKARTTLTEIKNKKIKI